MTSRAEIDFILTAQFAVAWAGEGGDEPRLGWWRTELASEYGGEDLFARLLPKTWRWAVLQGTRAAAQRCDAAQRAKDHNPDRIFSLFNLGYDLEEELAERLRDLKLEGNAPKEALPGLAEVFTEDWDAASFGLWVDGHGTLSNVTTSPVGRRLAGDVPASAAQAVKHLVRALARADGTLSDSYPLPHYRRGS